MSAPPGERPRVVLIVGAESTLRADARRALRTRLLGGGPPGGFDEDRFDLAESGVDGARVIAAARIAPMLAPLRWVEVRGLADKRAQAFLDGPLQQYLTAPVASTCLVLDAERVDRRQKWLKRVSEVGQLIECSAPTRAPDVRRWIEERVRERGKKCGSGAAQLLFESIGADLDQLAREVEKLCLYVGERAEIHADAVAQLTGALRARAIYELTDLVGQRQLEPALRMLQRLLQQGEAPLAVLGALASHFRRLLRARACSPLTAAELQKRLGLHPYAAERLVAQTKRYSDARLCACLELAQRADEVLKGALPLDPDHALEQLVISAAS